MKRLLPAAVVLLIPILLVASQARPDFSGRWTSDPDPAAPAPPGARGGQPQRSAAPAAGSGASSADMGSGWGATIGITQSTTQLTVEYAFFARGDMQPPLRFVYALDVTETKTGVMMGRGVQVQSSRTAWRGDALVITTSHTFADPATGKPAKAEVTQTLTLESPTSLVVETTRAGVFGGPSSSTKTVYRKQGL